jgi:hypothetical protein
MAMSACIETGHGVRVLTNVLLGFLAVTIWTTNYVVYFAPEIRAWRRRRAERGWAPGPMLSGPLPPQERHRFPSPPPPEVHDAEIIPFPRRLPSPPSP